MDGWLAGLGRADHLSRRVERGRWWRRRGGDFGGGGGGFGGGGASGDW
jgi:hypothetical protein